MYIAGIDIGGTNLKFGVFDDGLELVYSRVIRSVRADTLLTAGNPLPWAARPFSA